MYLGIILQGPARWFQGLIAVLATKAYGDLRSILRAHVSVDRENLLQRDRQQIKCMDSGICDQRNITLIQKNFKKNIMLKYTSDLFIF